MICLFQEKCDPLSSFQWFWAAMFVWSNASRISVSAMKDPSYYVSELEGCVSIVPCFPRRMRIWIYKVWFNDEQFGSLRHCASSWKYGISLKFGPYSNHCLHLRILSRYVPTGSVQLHIKMVTMIACLRPCKWRSDENTPQFCFNIPRRQAISSSLKHYDARQMPKK